MCDPGLILGSKFHEDCVYVNSPTGTASPLRLAEGSGIAKDGNDQLKTVLAEEDMSTQSSWDFLFQSLQYNPTDSHFEFPLPISSLFLRDTMVTFLPRATDEDLQSARISDYPKQVLYFIASFIALISLCHFFSISYHFIIRKRIYEWKRRTTVSLTRLPAAVTDSFRALAFRWTVPVGLSHELNFVEVGLTLAYMAVLYTWAFVNSMLHLFP